MTPARPDTLPSSAPPRPPRPPRLYHFRVSHYSEKVRWALDWKRWPHRRTALVPAFHAPRALLLSGQIGLPVLTLERRTVADSTRIIAEIERLRPDPPLYPADAALRERALALEDHFDEEVAPDLRTLFWSCYIDRPDYAARMATVGEGAVTRLLWRGLFPVLRPLLRRDIELGAARIERARGRLSAHFDRLEAEIGPSGFLAGPAFSIADLTAAAVMAAIIRPQAFPYALPEPWPPALVELRASVEGRAGVRWVLDMYTRFRSASAEVM